MTYSQLVKEELSKARLSCETCSRALAEAMLLFGSPLPELYYNDREETVELLAEMIVSCTGVVATAEKNRLAGKRHAGFRLVIEDTEDANTFYKEFQEVLAHRFTGYGFHKSCCKSAFLRGAFLTCGVLVNPEKEYHFEFKLEEEQLADELFSFLQAMGSPFKQTLRKEHFIVYLKGSEPIEDMLTLMGAPKAAMELMQVKLLKDLRNKVNRQTNCETANLDKTVKASVKQVDDIEWILQSRGELGIPEDLREVANIRLENPDASLAELAGLLPFGLSRSGLNHRLKRLSKIAEELRKNAGKEG